MMRTAWTPEQNALLIELWGGNVKLEVMTGMLGGRNPEAIYDHARKVLKLGKRRAFDHYSTHNWKLIEKALRRKPMTTQEIAAASGVPYGRVRELIFNRHGDAVYVHAWTTTYRQGGPMRIWGLGLDEDAPRPPRMTHSEIVKRYKERVIAEKPEMYELWQAREKNRREQAKIGARADMAAAWLTAPIQEMA